MGELGGGRRYHYWSDRGIQLIVADYGIHLRGGLRLGLKSPAIPFFPQLELGQEQRELHRNEVAQRIETAIGLQAVEDFVTPPPVSFAKGTGHVEVAQTTVRYASNEGAVIHVTAKSSEGSRVEVCLFGSMDNFPRYIRTAPSSEKGWTSSAWYAIEELLLSHGTINTYQWDDDEQIAVEALQIALHQGETGHTKDHAGKPWTRGFTIGGADDVEWFAEIYKDVELDKKRWSLEDNVDRILVGAPLWMRTALPQPIDLYHKPKSSLTR